MRAIIASARAAWLVGACLVAGLALPATARAQKTPDCAVLSEQLGVKPLPREGLGLREGETLTGVLVTPAKLEKFGVKGMHAGARVTVVRISPDAVRIEADELDPVMKTEKSTVTINEKGELVTKP